MLPYTTSAIGPMTEPRGDVPVLSKATTSRVRQSATPASRFEVSAGAYQFSIGMMPPARPRSSRVAPSWLRGPWHATQCPRPPTR